jgi:hypothetical protein
MYFILRRSRAKMKMNVLTVANVSTDAILKLVQWQMINWFMTLPNAAAAGCV